MGVLLPLRLAFEGLADGGDGLDLPFVDDVGGGARAAVAGVGELQDAGGRDQRQSGEVGEQPRSGLDLSAFQRQTVAFEHAEHFLDAPAQAIEADDFEGIFDAFDRQRRQQAPPHRLNALGGIDLASNDHMEIAGFGVLATRVFGPGDADLAERHRQAGLAPLGAGAGAVARGQP